MFNVAVSSHRLTNHMQYLSVLQFSPVQSYALLETRQSVAVQREGGILVGKKILHPYQNP